MVLFCLSGRKPPKGACDLDILVYIGRFFRYLAGRLVLLGIAVGLVILAFFVCMDYMNINVLVRDGFYKRAATIIMEEDPSVLVKVFTKSFIDKDTLLKSRTYADYVVRGFNHKVDVDFRIIFPWDNVVEVTMTEKISYIDGELPEESIPEGATGVDTAPPEWQDGRYKLTLVRAESVWKIAGMELVEALPKPEPSPSPSPSRTASASTTIAPETTVPVTTGGSTQ